MIAIAHLRVRTLASLTEERKHLYLEQVFPALANMV
jgi:hypothetical protein